MSSNLENDGLIGLQNAMVINDDNYAKNPYDDVGIPPLLPRRKSSRRIVSKDINLAATMQSSSPGGLRVNITDGSLLITTKRSSPLSCLDGKDGSSPSASLLVSSGTDSDTATSECARSYTTGALTPDPAPTLITVPKKRSALASVANPYDRKKKSKPLSGKENLGLVSKNNNDVKSSIAEMEMKPRAVSLSPEDKRFELHYPWAHGPIKSHGDLFFKITGVKAYSTTCPPEKMLEGLVEDRYTKVFC